MALKKTAEPTATTLRIGNIDIELGRKYILDHKFDGSAPDGLKKIEATRLPFERNSISDCVWYDEMKGLYDTGFYPESMCLSQYKPEEREELVKAYNKFIKVPYESLSNKTLTANSDNPFYKDYKFELYVNKEFDTTNPLDLFDLFNAILQTRVCAKDERNPFYNSDAQFNLSNPSEVKNKAKDKVKKRRQAFEKLTTMADANRDKLDLVLEYIGRDNPAKVDTDDLKDIYFEIIHDKATGMDFVDRFLESSSKYDSEAGKEEMEFFAGAKRLLKASKIKKDKSGFKTVNGEQFLGITLQDVATKCMNKDSIQYKTVLELIDELPE